jgi:branched-subunit amino acid ABC-type transport system permease component
MRIAVRSGATMRGKAEDVVGEVRQVADHGLAGYWADFAAALVYALIFARVAAREAFATSVATIGLAGVLQAAVGIKYGTAPLSLPDVVSTRAFRIGGAVVPVADIVAVAMAAAVLVLTLRHCQLGLRMNAVADNATLAVHLGINSAPIATVAWVLAGGTAALAGIAFSMRSAVDPAGVATIGLLAFPAIILGGLGSGAARSPAGCCSPASRTPSGSASGRAGSTWSPSRSCSSSCSSARPGCSAKRRSCGPPSPA